MKIRKIAHQIPIIGKILNIWSNSTEDAYSADYINKKIEAKLKTYYIPTNIGDSSGWYLALSGNITGYANNGFILSIQDVREGYAGQLYVNIRSNNSNVLTLINFKWLSNTGLDSSNFKLKLDGNNYYLYMKTPMNYRQYQFKVIQDCKSSSDGDIEDILTFYTPTASDTVEEPNGVNPEDKNCIVSMTLNTSYQNVPGVEGTYLSRGVWLVTANIQSHVNTDMWEVTAVGVMNWYDGNTNSTEIIPIPTHQSGHASNSRILTFATQATSNPGVLHLAVKCDTSWTGAQNIKFTFKKLM